MVKKKKVAVSYYYKYAPYIVNIIIDKVFLILINIS